MISALVYFALASALVLGAYALGLVLLYANGFVEVFKALRSRARAQRCAKLSNLMEE